MEGINSDTWLKLKPFSYVQKQPVVYWKHDCLESFFASHSFYKNHKATGILAHTFMKVIFFWTGQFIAVKYVLKWTEKGSLHSRSEDYGNRATFP